MKGILYLILVTLLCSVQCARILVVFPMPAPSHYILGNALARGLANAGHDVTMVSPFEEKNPPKNGSYRDILLTGFTELRDKGAKEGNNMFDMENVSPIFQLLFLNWIGDTTTKMTFEHPNFQKLTNSNEKFDVVIIEQFQNDALKVLAYHYKAPLIMFSTIGANRWVNPLVGNPEPPSYVPDLFLSYSGHMTFWQRLKNSLFGLVADLNRHLIFFPSQNRIMKSAFPDAPDLNALLYNVSLVLLNSHESTNQPVPHVPNMVDIGGFHVNPPKKLPKDLQTFIDSATDGVVYFSMGSNLKPSQMPKEKRDAIFRALGKLRQKVLWKWDEENMEGKPENVKLSKWFPQPDILAHPNTKVFITHGGLLSTTETVYHGVPVLTFPIFGDQKMNAARIEANGYGLSIPFSQITEEKVSAALDKLLNDPKYRAMARRRSKIMHDRPVKPMDLAVFWTEYVIRHKGAPHLRVAALDLAWYQYLMLDALAVVGLASLVAIFVVRKIATKVCCSSKRDKDKKKIKTS